MAFKSAPREYQGTDPSKDNYVVSISDEQAKHAMPYSAAKAAEYREQVKEAQGTARPSADELDKAIGSANVPAKYKIEVYFGPKRTTFGPNSLTVKFWESGRRLHGGGDDLMYMCRNRENFSEGCGKLFVSDCVTGPVAICSHCQKAILAELCVRVLVFKDERPTGGQDYRIETRKLAELLAKYWRKLDGNADIYCKFDQSDIQYIAMVKKLGAARARELRGLSIYPLKNLLADTQHGASLEDRIFSYLTA